MDSHRNPFAPGAGTPPPELAGREPLLERALVALDRIRAGRTARSTIFYGLRGVGKTVLLGAVREAVEAERMLAVAIEAAENRSLPALIVPSLRAGLLRLDRAARAGEGEAGAARARRLCEAQGPLRGLLRWRSTWSRSRAWRTPATWTSTSPT